MQLLLYQICTRKTTKLSPKFLKSEAEQAVADSCMEIQLTAQDTAAYGKILEIIYQIL